MGYRYDDLAPGETYHLFTRGVEQRDIFLDDNDRQRFMALLLHCLPVREHQSFSVLSRYGYKPSLTVSGEGLVDLYCYCLMSNHIHLLVRENVEGGISLYMKRLLTSYSMYFNHKNKRSGSLFLHPFKALLVNGDDYFLHLTRYIHLNPYVAHMVKCVADYRWSSLHEYIGSTDPQTVHHSLLAGMMDSEEYRNFVFDEADYARSLGDLKNLLVDIDD